MTYRIGFLTTHPIQYQVPVFRCLADHPDLDFTVYYCQLPDARTQGDGFGTSFTWDVPLLDGYRYEVLRNVARQPSVTSFSGCDTPALTTLIRQGDFDAFVVNGWLVKSCLQAIWACRRARVPCIVRGEANTLRPRPWWKHLIHRKLLQQFSAFLYIGQANARFYRSHGVSDDLLFPAPYCVDNERFATAADTVDRDLERHRFGLRSDSTVFLFSGKLIEKKKPLELLAAVQSAVRTGANLECLIVGDGDLRSECESYASQFNLPVRFTGFLNQSDIVRAYVAADCLLLPSNHGETWGLVVNEAMACGRPAIVSDQVGCSEDLVIPRQTGAVFEFGNWEQLAALLIETAGTPAKLRNWGLAAHQHIAGYSPQAAADGVMQAVAHVCGFPAST